jgi:hypothetical protein
MSSSPTQLSLKKLRDAGYLAEVVEKRNPHTRTLNDLYGFIDILAIRPGEVLGVQTTSNAHVANRCSKIADHPNVAAVREAGIRLEVHGWSQKKKGARYECRVVDVS